MHFLNYVNILSQLLKNINIFGNIKKVIIKFISEQKNLSKIKRIKKIFINFNIKDCINLT